MGQKCPAGTPDAGKVADVKARSWLLTTKTVNGQQEQTEVGGATTLKPADLKFNNRQLITLGFGPPGTQLPKPPSSTILLWSRRSRATSPWRRRRRRFRSPRRPCRVIDEHDGADQYDHGEHHDHQSGHIDLDDEASVNDHHDEVMKAVVLVGGEGTRLRPLTLTAPKQMLPIVGVPMIERVLGHLASHGVDEAVLSLGYLPDAFTEAYPEGTGRRAPHVRRRARAPRHRRCRSLCGLVRRGG